MNKKQLKKLESLRSVSLRVNANLTKETKKETKSINNEAFNKLVHICTNQNELIDLCAYAHKTRTETINLLVDTMLCKHVKHASTRLNRHVKVDITTAIVKASELIQVVSAEQKQELAQAQAQAQINEVQV
jgi:hypothetical protein